MTSHWLSVSLVTSPDRHNLPKNVLTIEYAIRFPASCSRITAQIWLCLGRIARWRLAAIMGISSHSWASEKDAMLVLAMKRGSSLCPPDAQFSRTMPGISLLILSRNP